MRYATTQIDPLEMERRAYDNLFDKMDEYAREHPEATDDECFEAVCFGPYRARFADYAKDNHHEG